MEINPNRGTNPVNPVGPTGKSKAAATAGPVDGETSFEQSSHLSSALAATPATRLDVIARAEELVAQATYPPREVINRIANLLAANLIAQA